MLRETSWKPRKDRDCGIITGVEQRLLIRLCATNQMDAFSLMLPMHRESAEQAYRGYVEVHQRLFAVEVSIEKEQESEEEKERRTGEQPQKKRRRVATTNAAGVHQHLDSSPSPIRLCISSSLASLLQPHASVLLSRIRQCKDVAQTLTELCEMTERLLSGTHSHSYNDHPYTHSESPLLPPQFLANLLQDAQQQQQQQEQTQDGSREVLRSLDIERREMQLCHTDAGNREHLIVVRLPPITELSSSVSSSSSSSSSSQLVSSSSEKLQWRAVLPRRHNNNNVDGEWHSVTHWDPATVISAVLRDVRKECERYQSFWNEMDHIDANTWVLEPRNPSRAALSRRIALSEHCSLQLTIVNPLRARAPVRVRVLGPEQSTRTHIQRLHRDTIRLWKEKKNVVDNIESILGVSLPQQPTEADYASRATLECAICYSYRLVLAPVQPQQDIRKAGTANEPVEGKGNGGSEETENGLTPDCLCHNTHCNRAFHRPCLSEWLRSMPSARQSFDTMFGECPYCSQPITVKL